MRATVLLACSLTLGAALAAEPKVRQERPRIFVRAGAWAGPSVEKIRSWMKTPEYQMRAKKLRDFPQLMSNAVLYVICGDQAAGKKAVEEFKKFKIAGRSNTLRGDAAQKCAALYDWLHDHPDFDAASRKAKMEHMIAWADGCVKYLSTGGETPFYCRLSSMLTGLTCVGLSLAGDTPKADGYVRYARKFFCEKYGTIRQAEDGATAGASYGLHYVFTHMGRLAAVWRSATDWDAAQWIKKHQGDWLRRQIEFQSWWTYPNGWFVKDGDIWAGKGDLDALQFRMGVDSVTSACRSGLGRAWATEMARHNPDKKYFARDYHSEYIWEFFVFNDPEVKPRPLSELGRAAVFSPKLHAFVCWRSSWKPDATVIHFKCGDNVDNHCTRDTGRFTIFKQKPLAIKSGAYVGWKSKAHKYLRSAWSANCVMFNGPRFHGYQPSVNYDYTPSWKKWKAKRDRMHPPTGVLLAHEAKDGYARALADLSGSQPGNKWTREIVFLGYKYLLVLDRVRPGAGNRHRWTLHTVNRPKIEGSLAVADNAPGRLFCKTMLPEKARLTVVGGFEHLTKSGVGRTLSIKKKYDEKTRMGQWRLDVAPADPKTECVYLHVLLPTTTETKAMPDCSATKKEQDIVVSVGQLTYTFKPGK